jgi:hypothetical protein
MTRLLLVAALLITSATPALAETEPDAELTALADEAGVEPLALLGAVNTTGMAPRQYLVAVGHLAPPPTPRAVPPYGLSPYLARVASCESGGFRPDVVYGPTRGRAGEIGLFQLHPAGLLPLFRQRGYTDPWNPLQQAEFATWAFGAGLARHWSCA